MCSKLIFCSKLPRNAKIVRGYQNRKKLLQTLKVAQKLPSTIGTGLILSSWIDIKVGVFRVLSLRSSPCLVNSQLSCSLVMDIILTQANHWCILTVKTVMNTPWKVPTNANGTFISLTLNIVQPNPSTSLAKKCPVWSTDSRRIPKLTTDNSRIIYIPVIVTNSSPSTSVIDLNSALSRPPSSNQFQSWCIKELRFIYWI